jgi:hypothetical protein
MSETQWCCERVYGARAVFLSRCSRMGVVEHDGKWYCKQHSPAAKAERNRKWREKYEAETRIFKRKSAIAAAEREVIMAAREWAAAAERDADTATNLVLAVERLKEAEEKGE